MLLKLAEQTDVPTVAWNSICDCPDKDIIENVVFDSKIHILRIKLVVCGSEMKNTMKKGESSFTASLDVNGNRDLDEEIEAKRAPSVSFLPFV